MNEVVHAEGCDCRDCAEERARFDAWADAFEQRWAAHKAKDAETECTCFGGSGGPLICPDHGDQRTRCAPSGLLEATA